MTDREKHNIDFRLSLNESLIIKGIAICLMLWHHLFYLNPEYGGFVFQTAQFGKVCVSLFLFASAYGLTVQYNKVFDRPITETFKFMAKRFVKFYANYWIVFLIFVPIGVFIFGRHLSDAYGSLIPVRATIRDFLGINIGASYNVTWWFNSLIIYLYLLFPILYFVGKRWPFLLLIVSIILWKFQIPILPSIIHDWLFAFSLGIVCVLNTDKINHFLNKTNYWLLCGLLLVTFLVLFFVRQYPIIPYFNGIQVDGFITLNIVVLVILIMRTAYFGGALKFLGKHSINIYMIHTFIFYYWFSRFIYSFKYPALIFVGLLAICLIISIILEYGKKAVNLSTLINNVNKKIENKL
jgi:peptidoglycan/LPS O-acetylase OafA/YrhL